ncbi:uncharacterized protein BDV17DRAFT_252356 [Aspergillus undulatus]|uniref:uncharacterized protein n=1 Tax=Aspergillus undulatus TaxID=1810928 RepID=UPI003CCD9744
MVAKVAVLADYYECQEAVSTWVDPWINAVQEAIPKTCSRDLILWLWVSWLFKPPAHFKEATSTAMLCSDRIVDALQLPILYHVIRSIDDRRQEAIADLFSRLDETRDSLLRGSRDCSFECISIMYGALSIQMESNALLSSRTAPPFPGLNYKGLVQKVLSFTSPK